MKFASGMEEAIRVGETFADDVEAAAYWCDGTPDVPFEDVTYAGAEDQPQRARLYRGSPDAPVLLFIHGGGCAGGSIELHEPASKGLVQESGWNVLSISYRLAPKHPYPAGLNDCVAAYHWLQSNGADFGLTTDQVALGGASAGANLAIAATLALPAGSAAGLVLYYGVFGGQTDTASYLTYQNGPGLTQARMAELFGMYDPDLRRLDDPLLTPLLSNDLAKLPASCLIAAEHDVLLEDSRMMFTALQMAGVDASLHVEPGVTHGFINRGRLVPAADACISRAAQFMKTLQSKR